MNITSGQLAFPGRSANSAFRQHLQTVPKFGEKKTDAKPVEEKSQPAALAKKKPFYKKIRDGLLWAAPVTEFISGALLITSYLLPGSPHPQKEPLSNPPAQTQTVLSPSDQTVPAPAKTVPISNEDKAAEDAFFSMFKPVDDLTMDQVKNLLSRIGWTLTSMNLFVGTFNGITFAFVNRQPSMVIASGITMVFSPLLAYNPEIFYRAMLGLGGAFWLKGLANTWHNEYQVKHGHKPREFDMFPLINKAELKKLMKPEDAESTIKVFEAWLKYMGKTAAFVGKDHAQLFIRPAKAIGKAAKNPKLVVEGSKKGFQETIDYARGRRKEVPEYLRPSAAQNDFASLSGMLTLTPMLIFHDNPEVVSMLYKLNAAGDFASHLSFLMAAIHEKDYLLGSSLFVGTYAGAHGDTDWGVGLGKVTAGFAVGNFMRKLVFRKDERNEAEAAKEAAPVPLPAEPEKAEKLPEKEKAS